MRILFVYPEHGRVSWEFPHSFAFLSSYVKQYFDDLEIDYVDVNLQSMDYLYDLYKKKEHDIVALTGLTSHYASIKELIKFFQSNKFSRTTIVVGGTIISSYPDYMIRHLRADYYVLNEGEEAFVECIKSIAEDKELKDIKNVGYLDGNNVVINDSRPLIQNLDSLPWQDFETFGFRSVLKRNGYNALVFASRGCPFNCGFCYRLYGKSYRTRSVESVLAEIEYLVKEYKVYRISFADELFFFKKRNIVNFCNELMKKKWSVTWHCALRANLVEPDLLKLMKKAGCLQIGYGIESGSNEMLNRMNKCITAEQNRNAIKMTIEAGIFPGVNLIIGYPGETADSIRETEQMMVDTKCHGGMHFIQALPGSPMYAEVRDAGFIGDEEQYFLSLQNEIHGLPIDFTGLGKEYIESEQKRIMQRLHKYYIKQYNKFRINSFMFYLRHLNMSYFRLLPARLFRTAVKKPLAKLGLLN